ncbi:MAG: Hsp20/alpha crystallin family protein [Dehalococcoidales bacterium]|nr:Hsp20/alpha crystallin family protein [Dehalococcoidales bacterium]
MAMQRWEPFKEMMSLRNAMDRLLEESFVSPSRLFMEREGFGTVPLDVYQTDKEVVVKASLPGYKPEEVDISITGDVLTIRGEHKEEQETKEENYFYKERRYGSFSRSIPIPVEVKSEKAEATFDNGILMLKMPKMETSKPKQIKVKAGKAQLESGKKTTTAKKS